VTHATEKRQAHEVRRVANARYVESISRIAWVPRILRQSMQDAQMFPCVCLEIVVSESRAGGHVYNEDDRQQPEPGSGATADSTGQSRTLPLLQEKKAKGISEGKARDFLVVCSALCGLRWLIRHRELVERQGIRREPTRRR